MSTPYIPQALDALKEPSQLRSRVITWPLVGPCRQLLGDSLPKVQGVRDLGMKSGTNPT